MGQRVGKLNAEVDHLASNVAIMIEAFLPSIV